MPAAPPWSLTSEPLDWDLSAVHVLRLLRADSHPAALLGTWAGGSDIIAAEPRDVRSEPESVLAALVCSLRQRTVVHGGCSLATGPGTHF